MSKTPLYEKIASSGARAGEYCGAETSLGFTDPRSEFAALVRGCGVYDLGWRAHFRISGRDRVRWLNSMVSNNIRELPPRRGNYNFVLTPQAHIQGDLYVFNLGDYFIAGTERSQFDKLLALLRRYIIMDKVELTGLDEELTAIGLQGPSAREVLDNAGFRGPLPQSMELAESAWRGETLMVTRMDERFETYEIWLPPAAAFAVWDALIGSGATPVGTETIEMFRVSAGRPRYGLDIRERDLPQETGQLQALSFTKGCYIGQEIVERIRSRGSVHRLFTGLTVQLPLPQQGQKSKLRGKKRARSPAPCGCRF